VIGNSVNAYQIT